MTHVSTRAESVRATLMVALAASSWGCWSLFLRPTGLSAWETTPLLFLVSGLVLAPFVKLDRIVPRFDRTTFALIAANTIFDAVNVLTFFAAMTVTTVGVAVLTHYMAPLFVALAAPWVEGEHVRGSRLAALVATLGLALVLHPWQEPAKGLLWGATLGLVSAVAYAGNVFVVRRLAERIGPMRVVSWHSLMAGLLLLPLAHFDALRAAPLSKVALLTAGIVVLSAGGGCLFLSGLRVIGSTRGSMLTFMEPIVAVIIGWLAWGEPLGVEVLLGGGCVLAAGVWVSLQPRAAVVERRAG